MLELDGHACIKRGVWEKIWCFSVEFVRVRRGPGVPFFRDVDILAFRPVGTSREQSVESDSFMQDTKFRR